MICSPNASSFVQDEKALKFFLTVPKQWRLFWAIHSIAMSFALAFIAIVYAGDISKLWRDDDESIFKNVPSWVFGW